MSIGNAGLRPEFTNSFEANYSNVYTKGANLLISAYYKHNTNLITNYIYRGVNPDKTVNKQDSVYYSTYINAQSSNVYGLELTNRITVLRIWDVTANLNLFNSEINGGSNVANSVSQQRWSYFAKLNNNFKLKKGYSIQLSGDYQSKTILPASSGSARNGGGGGGWGGPSTSAQGFIYPRYSFDVAIRKEWTLKAGSSVAATLEHERFCPHPVVQNLFFCTVVGDRLFYPNQSASQGSAGTPAQYQLPFWQV